EDLRRAGGRAGREDNTGYEAVDGKTSVERLDGKAEIPERIWVAVGKIRHAPAPYRIGAAPARVFVAEGEGVVLGRAVIPVVAVAVRVKVDGHAADDRDLAVELVAVASDVKTVVRDLEAVDAKKVVTREKGGAEGDVGVGAGGATADGGELEGGV